MGAGITSVLPRFLLDEKTWFGRDTPSEMGVVPSLSANRWGTLGCDDLNPRWEDASNQNRFAPPLIAPVDVCRRM